MKKWIVAILVFLLSINCFTISAFAQDSSNVYGYANYTDSPPVIDGIVDSVWLTTEAYFAKQNCVDGQAYAAVKILWDEKHLYFYAKVYDETISCCDENSVTNGINFWVSETNSNLDTYMDRPGDWHVFCNQNGKSNYYTGNVGIIEQSVRATSIHDGYYIVECAVAIQTDGLVYQNGHIIGFDVSVDDDINGDNVRDYYCYWEYLGKYWDETGALANIQLAGKENDVDNPTEPTTPADETTKPTEAPTNPQDEPDESLVTCTDNIFIRFLLEVWNFILKLFCVK